MSAKTNAMRIVEQAGFPCRDIVYDYDENDLSGNHIAKITGLPEEQVFKTLVTRGERTGINVFCIPVCCELNLKAAANEIQSETRRRDDYNKYEINFIDKKIDMLSKKIKLYNIVFRPAKTLYKKREEREIIYE